METRIARSPMRSPRAPRLGARSRRHHLHRARVGTLPSLFNCAVGDQSIERHAARLLSPPNRRRPWCREFASERRAACRTRASSPRARDPQRATRSSSFKMSFVGWANSSAWGKQNGRRGCSSGGWNPLATSSQRFSTKPSTPDTTRNHRSAQCDPIAAAQAPRGEIGHIVYITLIIGRCGYGFFEGDLRRQTMR